MTLAASASSPICTIANHMKSLQWVSRSCAISIIAARSARIPRPATAVACSSRSRIVSLSKRRSSSASPCRTPGDYAIGALFLPRDPEGRRIVEAIVERVVAEEGQVFLGWRDVPVDPSGLGESVKPTEPVIRQLFIGRAVRQCRGQDLFERRLFILRKVISNAVYD